MLTVNNYVFCLFYF